MKQGEVRKEEGEKWRATEKDWLMWKRLKILFNPAWIYLYIYKPEILFILLVSLESHCCKQLLQWRHTYTTDTISVSNLLRLELRKHDTGGTHPERAQQLVNDAMHVVERQGVEDDVIFGPRPLWNQTLDLSRQRRGQQVKMSQNKSLHFASTVTKSATRLSKLFV